VTAYNRGGGGQAEIRVTVNGVEMTTTETYLADAQTTPVGVFGGDADELEFTISVTFASLPLQPVSDTRTVAVSNPRR
jgi:hypothetical protein